MKSGEEKAQSDSVNPLKADCKEGSFEWCPGPEAQEIPFKA